MERLTLKEMLESWNNKGLAKNGATTYQKNRLAKEKLVSFDCVNQSWSLTDSGRSLLASNQGKPVYFVCDKGRAVRKYDGQTNYQPQILEIYSDGKCYFTYNAEIGSAVPEAVFNGRIRRFSLGNDMNMTHQQQKEFFKENKEILQRIVNGMSDYFDSNGNHKGRLSDDAAAAEYELDSIINSYDWI